MATLTVKWALLCLYTVMPTIYTSPVAQAAIALIASGGGTNTYGGGLSDGFLVKFDENGGRLWATYAGNSGEDLLQGVATDRYNNVVVCGTT